MTSSRGTSEARSVREGTLKERPKRIGLGASGSAARTPSRMRGALAGAVPSTPRTLETRTLDIGSPARVVRIERVRIVVSGGASGFIGSALVPSFEAAGHEVVRLVRREASGNSEVSWNPAAGQLDAAALGVELQRDRQPERRVRSRSAGPQRGKREIMDSRVDTTSLLARTAAALEPRPSVFLCAGGAGIYGDRGDEVLTEESSSGAGFLGDVCRAWEAAADPARAAGIRVVTFRHGIVLARGGGALARLLTPFRLGVGGRIGSGRQWWTWVGMPDVVAAYAFALEGDLSGAVNLCAPNPVTNEQLTHALGRALRRPTVLPLPAFAARLAFGEMADELLLGGQRALPGAPAGGGFDFTAPTIDDGLAQALTG